MKLTPDEAAKYMNWCNAKGIRIYAKNAGANLLKLVVETNGRQKTGQKEYPTKPGPNDPKWYEVIQNLYVEYYNKNFENQPI